ncbi:hypothetical protein BaRGS_00016708, partial [Batillaria attramentaria]
PSGSPPHTVVGSVAKQNGRQNCLGNLEGKNLAAYLRNSFQSRESSGWLGGRGFLVRRERTGDAPIMIIFGPETSESLSQRD